MSQYLDPISVLRVFWCSVRYQGTPLTLCHCFMCLVPLISIKMIISQNENSNEAGAWWDLVFVLWFH